MKSDFISQRFYRKECCGVFLLALLLIFLKMPDRILHGFLWAEDISVFIKNAYEQGPTSLEIPYAGYLHLIPRLLAYAQSFFFTITTAPYFFVLATTFLTGLCSAYIFDAARRYFTSLDDTSTFFLENHLLALFMALSFFLVPHQGEVFLNITNLQWILTPTMLMLLLDIFFLQESSCVFLAIKTAALFLMALTGPFSILFLPFVCLLLISQITKIKTWNFLFPISGFFLALLIQAITLLIHQAAPVKTHSIHWWHQIVDDLCAQLFFVTPPTDFFLGRACILLLPFLIILSIAHCARRSLLPLALIITGLELWCVSIFIRQVPVGVTVHIGPCDYNARYYFVPAVSLAWSLILCIKLTPLKKKFLPLGLLSLLFITGIIRFGTQNHPQWEIIQEGAHYNLTAPCGWKATITIPPKGN